MRRYSLTPKAREGLVGILDYVEREFGAVTAASVLERLADAFEALARHPRLGCLRPEITLDASVRFHSVGPSLIAYRCQDGAEVVILFVERGTRDWPRLFGIEN